MRSRWGVSVAALGLRMARTLVAIHPLCGFACASQPVAEPAATAKTRGPSASSPRVARSATPKGDEGRPPEGNVAAPPATSIRSFEESAAWADCKSWGSARGRRPHSIAKDCAGPAADRHTTEHDAAALRKLDETIFVPYLSASFEQSKEHLLAISDACQDRCSPRVQARLWMYAGIVLASGLSRPEQAQCAFEVATAWDPKVALDEQLATPEAKTLFLVARAKMCEQAL